MSRQPIIILGMSRSGTSLVTDLLDSLGLFVGRDLEHNHESIYFQWLNQTVFGWAQATWDYPLPMRDFLACDDAMNMAAMHLHADVTFTQMGVYLEKGESLGQLKKPWGWKDPRNIFTLPLWLHLFPRAKLIYIVRNGIDVANSLMVRESTRMDQQKAKFTKYSLGLCPSSLMEPIKVTWSTRCLNLEGGFELWREYLSQAAEVLAGLPNPLISIRYEDFLAAPCKHLNELARFCDLDGATEAKVDRAAQTVRPERAMAFASNPALAAFAKQVQADPWMVRYRYSV